MKNRKILSLLLALVMVFSLTGSAFAAGTDSIVIVYTNDIHCAVDQIKSDDGTVTNMGFAGLTAYVKSLKAAYGEANVTLVDAGDAIQGEAIGTLSKGEYIVDIMDEVGYDICIPGNHEFDYGMDQFLSLAEKAKSDYVSSNFMNLLTGESVFDAYKIITYGDVSVAYVGVSTPETFTKSTPTYFQDDEGNYIYGFCEGNEGADLYAAVQSAVDAAVAAGADYVVAVGHLGSEGVEDAWSSLSVIANTTGICALIDGHSHSTVAGSVVKNKDGKDVLLTQTGTKLASIGTLVIDPSTGAVSSALVSGLDAVDEGVDAFVKDIQSSYEELLKSVVAKTDVDLTTLKADGTRAVRSKETNLGDLCADAYRIILGADIAFVNGGGVRANISAGDITYEDIIKVHPFGNMACVIEATGQQVIDALEMASRLYPEENGGFLQVSGLNYTIDSTIESSVVIDDKGSFVSVDGARRVKDVKVLDSATGEYLPIDLDKTYTLASHNYMLKSGGDGINMFMGNNVLQDEVMLDNQVLITYIQDVLGGVVGDEYSELTGQGRISIRGVPFLDVPSTEWYYAEIVLAYEKGIVDGVSETSFVPTANLKRQDFVTLLYRLAGSPEADVTKLAFNDVAADAYYASAIAWAVENNVVEGQSDTLFGVGQSLTRQDMVTLLYRYAIFADMDVSAGEQTDLQGYSDVNQVSEYALPAFKWACGAGVIQGTDEGLSPLKTSNRAMGTAVLLRTAAA